MIQVDSNKPVAWPSYMENEHVQNALAIAQYVAAWSERNLYGLELHARRVGSHGSHRFCGRS